MMMIGCYDCALQITIDGLARVMCMSEYLERELVAVPRLPLLSECAPLAAAVAGASTGHQLPPRYANNSTAHAPTANHSGESGGSRQRPTWRFVQLRLGKTGATVVEDHHHHHSRHCH